MPARPGRARLGDDVGAPALAPLLYIGQISLGIHHRKSVGSQAKGLGDVQVYMKIMGVEVTDASVAYLEQLNVSPPSYLARLFFISQFPDKSVNLSFTTTHVRNVLTDLRGN
jgi:hypothetical protein